jgi:hypothetical protein
VNRCEAVKHGSPTAYRQHGCRCPETLVVMSRYRYGGYRVVDEARVFRACEGERLWLNTLERKEAVRRLALRRMSAMKIAQRLHMHDRSVRRYMAKLREEYRRQAEAS